MSIDALPPAPAATDPVDTFDAKAFAFNAALQNFRTQANATADTMQINADILAAVLLGMALPDYAGTSASSFAIGTGSKTFATQTGKLWTVGQIVVVSNGSNLMRGPVTGYSAGNLTVNVTSIVGSGTFSSWTIGLTFDGLLVAKSGANADITDLLALATVPTVVSVNATPPVRQTVLAGPTDSNGLSAFGGVTGSTTVTASGVLTVTAANNAGNRTGTITNPSWTGLTANAFLYLDIASNGACTPGSTTLAPTYRWGGADVVASGQNTFNVQDMQMKVGNGSTASQVWRVFVGEVTASAGVVTSITWYALMGRYQGAYTNTFPGAASAQSFNHNIGAQPDNFQLELRCLTTDAGYAVGDVVRLPSAPAPSTYTPLTPWATAKSCGFTTGSSATTPSLIHKSTGTQTNISLANWAYRMTAQRGW